MSTEKVAIVTGANKGIGYAVVEGLCKKYKGVVYLTARNEGRGQATVAKLKELGFSPLFHQLDVADQTSVDRFKDYIKNKHGGIDILVNNAGVSLHNTLPTPPIGEEAEKTLEINYFGFLRVCDSLFPLLRNKAKVVNVSSSLGHLSYIKSADLKAKFSDPNLTIEGVNMLMRKFVRDAGEGKLKEEGWPSPYSVSKIGVSAASIVQQRNFDKEVPNRSISVNFVHPGYIDTDLTRHKGPLTVEQGAKPILYSALEADFKGKFVWYDCQLVDWYADSHPPAF